MAVYNTSLADVSKWYTQTSPDKGHKLSSLKRWLGNTDSLVEMQSHLDNPSNIILDTIYRTVIIDQGFDPYIRLNGSFIEILCDDQFVTPEHLKIIIHFNNNLLSIKGREYLRSTTFNLYESTQDMEIAYSRWNPSYYSTANMIKLSFLGYYADSSFANNKFNTQLQQLTPDGEVITSLPIFFLNMDQW